MIHVYVMSAFSKDNKAGVVLDRDITWESFQELWWI